MKTFKSTAPTVTSLDQLPVGVAGVVVDVSVCHKNGHDSGFDITRRLKELGFVKGEEIKILHRGYFGDEPLAVRIGQSTFALRLFEAALIGVSLSGTSQ